MMNRLALVTLLSLAGTASADEVAPPAAVAPTPPASRPVVRPPQEAPRADRKNPFGDPGPRRPMPPPPPIVAAPEVAKLAKQLVGTYRCKGVSLRGDGSSTPLEATYTLKLALDGGWIMGTFDAKTAGMRFEDYRTFDATAKQWTRIAMHSTSAHVVETSFGEKDGKWSWEGNQLAPTGTTQQRDFEQASGKQLKVWGEALLGGSWQKMYEVTCKR